mmetsp:Transcript_9424/g.18904  ORF Transcript_9424/g.18904 Transcript_9424/m.18904 type:complete len:412 (+) Transcript_9424:26-1261(+)
MSKEHDILLFGVTGFTGKLAAEYLLAKSYPVKWAVCARNESKAQDAMKSILGQLNKPETEMPKIEVADLVCNSTDEEEKLRAIVKKTKVVITTAGPFEKYGQTLFKMCAEEGIHYADITGETDFFRAMIDQYDSVAQKSGAVCVVHCGNDCIPWDLTVFEMNKVAKDKGAELVEVSTFTELPPTSQASGGTTSTAVFQLSKKREKGKTDFDPLLRMPDGSKSSCATKITSPKSDKWFAEFNKNAGPWIMAPVMANCVRRSNALLQYNTELTYSEAQLRDGSASAWMRDKSFEALVGAAIWFPALFQRFLPQPGEGPSREAMDGGYLVVHGRGKAVNKASGEQLNISSTFRFNEDVGYLATAKFLVETGMLLLSGKRAGGVTTPAVALGSDIVQRLSEQTGAVFEAKIEPST